MYPFAIFFTVSLMQIPMYIAPILPTISKIPDLGGKYLVFLSSRSVKMRGFSAFSVCIFFEESVFIFQFLNDKMHNYVLFDIIVHFIIQKLKNKHSFLKKYTN